MARKRAGIAAAGALAVLAIASVALMLRFLPRPGEAQQSAPTQWIAKQTTELLGRGPTPSEWRAALSAFAKSGCDHGSLTAWGKPIALSSELNADYPEATAKVSRVLALIRASLNHEPSGEEWSRFFTPYSRGEASWPQTVASVYASPAFAAQVARVCNASDSNYHFGAEPPLDVPVSGHGPRTQAELQRALGAAAARGGVVELDPRTVIRIGGEASGNQGLQVPPGVMLTTSGSPKASRYADMARLVATGRICTGTACGHVAIVTVEGGRAGGAGGVLANIWVDGKGTGSDNPDPRFNYQIANVESTSGSGIRLADNRLSDPPPGGAALRADGSGTRDAPCGGETIAGNLITGYGGDHTQDRLGRGRWSDGVVVDCEDATVNENSVVDITGQGISMRGDFNRASAKSTNQQSSVVHNTIISAGASAFVALGADQVGDCLAFGGAGLTASTSPIPCLDITAPRPFHGARIASNTYWTGPRTAFHIGLMIGSEALFGDNADGTFGDGIAVTNNVAGVSGTRVNAGIVVGGMTSVTLRENSDGKQGSLTLVNATPGIADNPCALVGAGQAQSRPGHSGATFVAGSQPVTVVANDVPGPSARPSLYGCLVPDAPAGGLEMITTGTDSAGNHLFVGASSKRWFTPWGQNYGGPKPLPPHAGLRMLEDSLVDNWSGLVAGLRQQRQMGSTVVRILLDFDYVVGPPSSGHPDGTLRAENVAHIVRFARLAQQIGMYVDITGMCECRPQDKPGWYDGRMSDAERWAAQRVFWSALARALKDEPSIMVFNLANEPMVAATPPAEWAGGDYGGYSYAQVITRSGIADKAARAAKAVTWANQLVDAIRQGGDAVHLVTVGNLPGNLGYGGFYPPIVAGSNLSYLSVHEYPSSGHAAIAIADVQSFSHGKPVVVEETFLFADAPTEDAFIRGSAPAAAGWIGQWNSWSIAEIPPEDTYGIWHVWGQLSMRLAATISPLATIAN